MRDLNPEKELKFITYLNANKLYSWAMSERLPTNGFKWIKDSQLTKVIKLLDQRITNHGYLFEVDLEYPKELYEFHNDYPIALEKIKANNVE